MALADHSTDHLPVQMQTVKELYTELFMLMVESAEQDPQAETARTLDPPIESLMGRIDGTMRDFHETVVQARGNCRMPADLDREILVFQDQLKQGLTLVYDRIQKRMHAMASERDALKDRIRLVQRKRTGTRGYRQGIIAGFDTASEIKTRA